MSEATAQIRVGARLHVEGQSWDVIEWSGRQLVLRGGDDGELVRRVSVVWLLTRPDLRVLGDDAAVSARVAAAVVLDEVMAAGRAELDARVGEVQEVRTGFRRGTADLALPGEPRDAFGPASTLMSRYRAKATELGVGVSTVRRWVALFEREGPIGLVTRQGPGPGPLGRVDTRWMDMCRLVLAEHVDASRPTRAIILAEVAARLTEQYGPDVAVPAKSTAYELLRELTRGSNAFTGSTKGKRSIAQRPSRVYGRLRATRPGEYVLLDTNRLDVFAMEPVTCRWVQAELTVAMDLFTRCITGLRVTPVSTKAVDVAGVLYETVRPRQAGAGDPWLVPHGVPATVVLDAEKLVDGQGRPLLPSVAAETIVYDHGQIYLSEHVRSVCARLGISLQPARSRTPTDKSPLERWFRTLGEGLLVALPGYKGSDVHSRGDHDRITGDAFYFLDELEEIIREWIGLCYHRRAHRGLSIAQVPGLDVSPLEMFELGVQRAGLLQVPWRPDAAYDFLATVWTTVQHYGVEISGLRYDGPALSAYRNQRSGYRGAHAGKWPIGVDTSDRRAVFFQDPDSHTWHRLSWEHAPLLEQPFTGEAVEYARRLAARTQRFPDTTTVLIDLLERWGAGLTASAAERRMAARLAQQRVPLLDEVETATEQHPPTAGDLGRLPSLRRLAALSPVAAGPGPGPDPDRGSGPAEAVTETGATAPGDDAETAPDRQPDSPPGPTDHQGRDHAEDSTGADDFYADVMDSE